MLHLDAMEKVRHYCFYCEICYINNTHYNNYKNELPYRYKLIDWTADQYQ